MSIKCKCMLYKHISKRTLGYKVTWVVLMSDNPARMQQGIHSSRRSKEIQMMGWKRLLMTTLIHLASVFPVSLRRISLSSGLRLWAILSVTLILDNSGAVIGSQALPEHCIRPTLYNIACCSRTGPTYKVPLGPEVWMLREIFRRLS